MYPHLSDFLKNGYSYDSYEVARELTSLVNEKGNVSKARVYLKEIYNRETLPIIVKDFSGKYSFKRLCSSRVITPNTVTYAVDTSEFLSYHIKTGMRTYDGAIIYAPYTGTIYLGYDLTTWIWKGLECEECGTPFIQQDGETLCNICNATNTLLPYSAKAEDMLGMENTNEVRYGVELEYEGLSPKDIVPIKHHAIAKRDGSIHSGIEIVTKPAKLLTHKSELKKFYDKVKVKSFVNTGMHVHVEKKKLTEFQIGFMMEFLSHQNLIQHISTVAGREYGSNTYCKPKGHTLTFGLNGRETFEQKLCRSATDKYSPLNTSKEHTVEVRIFSSPESKEDCFAKLDFVAGLVKYSSPYSVSVKSLKDKFNWDIFLSFMASNRKEWPDFYNLHIQGN